MKFVPLFISAVVSLVTITARAAESVMLIAPELQSSPEIVLNEGDTAELKFVSTPPVASNAGSALLIRVTAGANAFNLHTLALVAGGQSPSWTVNPVRAVGPATVKLMATSGASGAAHYAVFEVNRRGTASGPVPIPQEAGTTWQVILEASSDLVNWTVVQPGNYPSSTPQKYFRTRLVKQ